MYNKIASIILNSASAAGLSDVYVAQPDSLKESLAGKIFILAEIGGKKSDGRKIFDFLILALTDNYYNDEKILFRGKIEGLKIENIFEAAITKTNKNLNDFLVGEKIKMNLTTVNITVGVIYENKLHFANFGRNRALLVYRRGEEYELINVEANAAEVTDISSESEVIMAKTPKFFSSVISGEVPLGSYFIFSNETLPEYLSGKEMINIITKLPPITAAGQIKNVLTKINTYVPFLGIIIKNTAGLPIQETREEVEENLSSSSSVSSLNYTEQKTEQMLAPAGLINFSKFFKDTKQLIKSWQQKSSVTNKKYPKPEETRQSTDRQPTLDLGSVRSMNLARSDSFLIKEKIFFKKKPGWLSTGWKNIFPAIINLFSPDPWSGLLTNLRNWLKSLNIRNRWLFAVLGLVILVFIFNLIYTNWNHQRQIAQTNFSNLTIALEDKENSIDSHLLYNDEAGANQVLVEAQALLSSLPKDTKDQQATYQRLAARLEAVSAKIQKISLIDQAVKVNDLGGLGVSNLVFASGKIYAASDKFIYELTPGVASSSPTAVNGADKLVKPVFDKIDRLYYQAGNRIAQFNIKTRVNSLINIAGLDQNNLTSFNIFNGNLYVLAKTQNQIYRYNRSGNNFSSQNNWLAETIDLNQASDLGIDGDIYVLKVDGSVLKFRKGKKVDYAAAALLPVMTSASQIIVGNNYLYIFETASKRLAVLAKKDGHLVNQYVVSSLSQPKYFTVDEAGRSAYFLDGEMIYKIDLSQ